MSDSEMIVNLHPVVRLPRFDRGVPEYDAKRKENARNACSRPMSAESKKRLSDALKARWASGTRKPTPKSAYIKALKTRREGFSTGRIKGRNLTTEQSLLMSAKIDRAKQASINRMLGKLNEGKEMPPGPGAKGPEHWKAKFWRIRSPRGVLIEGMNLSELIRRHAAEFDPADVVWRKSRCRASHGIRALFEGRVNGPTSWKGWTGVASFERPEDPLDRQPNPESTGRTRNAP